ncbi:E3 SUMO-protein ligase ZBED1-like [Argopecten irradians]|uniref:E3 SUMO-protein ligase ZBED1-like n=1 Tax=Argopecten irradians TaxID=31199 RepID=UPI00370FDCA7
MATKNKWNIPTPTATTDNAANEIKAFDILKWQRFGCYGHRINLAVKTALGIPEISKLLGKGRKLVAFFHQSSSAADFLRDHQLVQLKKTHKLIQDCPTKWNSSLSMLERLLEQTPPIMAVVHDPKYGKAATDAIKTYSYNFQEQGLVEKIVEVLKPFEIATSILCAENVPTLLKVIPTLLKLKSFTSVKEDDCPVIKKLKGQLADQVKKRSKDADLILLASVINLKGFQTKDLYSSTQMTNYNFLRFVWENVS